MNTELRHGDYMAPIERIEQALLDLLASEATMFDVEEYAEAVTTIGAAVRCLRNNVDMGSGKDPLDALQSA